MNLAYLERVDPARNMLRFKAIRIAPTLFGALSGSGLIGSPGRAAKLVRQRGRSSRGRA